MTPPRSRLLAALLVIVVAGLLVVRPWESSCSPDRTISFEDAEVDGSELLVTYVGGVPGSDGCESCAELEIEESAFEVVATLRVGEESGECNDAGQKNQLIVTLGSDLGDRLLRDGTTGEVVDVVSA